MTNQKKLDERYMQEALILASNMRGRTNPDPMVGAVVVRNNEIVGRGYHADFGMPHAEVYAIENAGKLAQGATIYVSLEPCCHWGNNPPCTQSIIRAGIKRVVIAMLDPNPLVKACDSVKILKKAGIDVSVGILEKEALKLNEVFVKHITTHNPFVILKMATTLDGRIADENGNSRWITGIDARQYVHRLRSEVMAIIVGINTVIKDDPILTVRDQGAFQVPSKKNPIRVVLDGLAKIPLNSKILDTELAETILVVSKLAPKDKLAKIAKKGINIITLPTVEEGRINLKSLLKELGKRNISSVLVEGGSALNASFLQQKLADKLFLFLAPKILGAGETIPAVKHALASNIKDSLELKDIEFEKVGQDFLIKGYL